MVGRAYLALPFALIDPLRDTPFVLTAKERIFMPPGLLICRHPLEGLKHNYCPNVDLAQEPYLDKDSTPMCTR